MLPGEPKDTLDRWLMKMSLLKTESPIQVYIAASSDADRSQIGWKIEMVEAGGRIKHWQ